MSWQDYIDSTLLGSGNLDQAAIYSADGASAWAKSDGFQIDPKEIPDVVRAFEPNSDLSSLMLNGEKYILVSNDGSLRLKKGKEGMVIARTPKALIIAHHPESIQLPNATVTVEGLADYLKKSGY